MGTLWPWALASEPKSTKHISIVAGFVIIISDFIIMHCLLCSCFYAALPCGFARWTAMMKSQGSLSTMVHMVEWCDGYEGMRRDGYNGEHWLDTWLWLPYHACMLTLCSFCLLFSSVRACSKYWAREEPSEDRVRMVSHSFPFGYIWLWGKRV